MLRLHAKIMRVALDEEDSHMAVPDLAEQLRHLLDKARAAGMRIAIENHFNYPSPRMVELLDTINDDTLGVCLDVANSICANEWPEETIKMLAPYTINLHLKDYEITPDPYGVGFRIHGTPLGQGRAPIPWILDQLTHCPADMSVLLEHWLPLGTGLEEARAQEQPWIEQTVAAAKEFVKGREEDVFLIRIPGRLYETLFALLCNTSEMERSQMFTYHPSGPLNPPLFLHTAFERVAIPKSCLSKWRVARLRIRVIGQLGVWQRAAQERLYAPSGPFCAKRAKHADWQALVRQEIEEMS